MLTAAATIPDAFLQMFMFEQACAIQIKAQSGGGELQPVDPRIQVGMRAQAAAVTKGLGGQLAWPGLQRKLDRIDRLFRE